MRHLYLFPPSADAPAIDVAAIAQRAGLAADDQLQTVQDLPVLQDLAQLATRFPADQQATLLRYWQAQSSQFSPKVASQYGILLPDTAAEGAFFLLENAWNNYPATTVCYKMQSDTLGVLIVFTAFTIDTNGRMVAAGQLAGPGGDLPFPYPVASGAVTSDAGDLESSIWTILNYIGSGLAADGFPVIGTIFQALFSVLANWLNPESDMVTEILDEVKEMLEQNNIKIEIDFATSEVDTWLGWESLYFLQADFDLLSAANPDKSAPAYQQALNRANNFITNVHANFMGTPRLFDAVNLMKGDTSVNSANLDFPTEAMYKYSAFLFFSSFVLLFGKQGWLYSQQINGKNDQTTLDLANAVAGYSSQYTSYVQKISASIQNQINQRTSYLQVNQSLGSGSWVMKDSYDGPYEQQHANPWTLFGYNGYSVFNCCGASDCDKAQQNANNAMNQVIADYTNFFYTQIDPSGQADLQQKIQAFIDNDAKLQNLKTSA